jgi:hypothetical protein
VHTGPAKPEPVYCRSIIENPLSLALLGEKVLANKMQISRGPRVGASTFVWVFVKRVSPNSASDRGISIILLWNTRSDSAGPVSTLVPPINFGGLKSC